MKERVTIEDIVQKTGISKSTVSRVLTGKGYASDEVRNTVTNGLFIKIPFC